MLFVKYRRIIILVVLELLILGGICLFQISQSRDGSVRNPEISKWESRYIVFDNGIWHCEESLIPEDDKDNDIDMLYGPFFSLEAGSYSVSIDYECTDDQTFQVYSFSSPDAIIVHEPEILKKGINPAVYHFTLIDKVEDLEIRFYYSGRGTFDVRNVSVVSSHFLIKELLFVLFILFAVLDICILTYRKQTPAGSREMWIDVCRGIGILLVLTGHEDPPFKWLIFGFHMPLFFILSGYLYKHCESTVKYAAKLFRQYIVPYYIFAVLNLIIRLIQMAVEDTVTAEWVSRYIFCGIADAGEWLPNALPLWFLPALFVTMLIMHFIHNNAFSAFQRIVFLLICLTGAALIDHFDCGYFPWCADRALMGIVFAEFGFMLKQKGVINKINTLKIYDKLGLIIIMLICGVNAVRYNFETLGSIPAMQPMRYGHILLWVAGALLLSTCLLSICSLICVSGFRNIFEPLSVLGKNTMVFFAFDFCLSTVSSRLLHRFLGYEPWYFRTPLKFLLIIPLAVIYHTIRAYRLKARNY